MLLHLPGNSLWENYFHITGQSEFLNVYMLLLTITGHIIDYRAKFDR